MSKLPERMIVWDTETSGVDVENDRILTCYAMVQNVDGTIEREWHWTIDPGVADGFKVPKAASDVHGMSTEWIAEHGRKDWRTAIEEIVRVLYDAYLLGIPIVAYNQRFDFSILWHEYVRAGRGTGGVLGTILEKGIFYDATIHEKQRNRFVKGKGMRTLKNTCLRYGIEFDDEKAHAAEYDVIKTAEISWFFLKKDKLTIAELYKLLPKWKEEQDSSLQAFFTKDGRKNDNGEDVVIDRGWPLITEKGN